MSEEEVIESAKKAKKAKKFNARYRIAASECTGAAIFI